MAWRDDIVRDIDGHGTVVRVVIVRADGSTPRETGAAMRVSAGEVHGTIGGGALELTAIAHARTLLATGDDTAAAWARDVRDFALGPSLGQCCGGHTRVLFEVLTMRERGHVAALARACDAERAVLLRPLAGGMAPCVTADRREHHADWPLAVTRTLRDVLSGARAREAMLVRGGRSESAWFIEPFARRTHRLYLYGAGHVGRALVHVLRDLPFDVAWIDTAASRFPADIPPHAQAHVTGDLAAFAAGAAGDAFHLVLTYSHALDLAICHSLLRRGDVRFLGLIGSATKRTRFLKRLGELGIADGELARLTCPIGLPGLGGKEPGMIAVSVAAQLVQIAAAPERLAADQPVAAERALAPR